VHRESAHFGDLVVGVSEEEQLAHVENLGVEDASERQTVGPLLAAAPEDNHAAVIFVSQELDALDVLEWVNIGVFLVEEDRVRRCEGVECLEDGVQGSWAF
jgi:hypothetical protein